MNPLGVGLVSVLGLLGVYLYLQQSAHVNDVGTEARAEMRCRNAKFDLQMAKGPGGDTGSIPALQKVVDRACGDFDSVRAATGAAQQERGRDSKALQDTIGNMMK